MNVAIRNQFLFVSELGRNLFRQVQIWWDQPDPIKIQRVFAVAGTALGVGAVLLLAFMIK